MDTAQIKDYFKQHFFAILLSITCLFCLSSMLNKHFYTILLIIVVLTTTVFFDINKAIIIWLVPVFFEQTNYFYALPMLLLICAIQIVKLLYLKKIKLTKNLILPLILTTLIIIMCFAVRFERSYFKEMLNYIIIFIICFEFYLLKNEFDFETITKFSTITLIASCVISIIFHFSNTGFSIFNIDILGLKRFLGLTTHENMLATYAVMFMSFNVLLYFKNRLPLKYFIISEIFLIVIGLATMSKAFLILFIVLIILYFIKSYMNNQKFTYYQIIIFSITLIVICILFNNKLYDILKRFFSYFNEYGILNMLTTGRYEIWKNFFELWSSSLSTIFFGLGASYKPYEYIHNFYLDIIFKFGLVGTILIVSLVVFYIYNISQNKKVKFENFIPLIIILLNLIVEVFIAKRIIVLFIAIIATYFMYEDVSQNKNNINEEKVLNDS